MKRICVIGAGASGLPAIKCCLDEKLIPLCYEKSHDIGGKSIESSEKLFKGSEASSLDYEQKTKNSKIYLHQISAFYCHSFLTDFILKARDLSSSVASQNRIFQELRYST